MSPSSTSPRMSRQMLTRVRDGALDFLFPPRCVVCGAGGAHLCDVCIAEFEPADGIRCPRCWATGHAGLCDRCEDAPPAFDSLRAAFVFDGTIRAAILAVKYDGLTSAVPALIDAVDIARFSRDLQLLTAVPMAGRRRRRRGYNQAEVIARRLAERLTLPFDARALTRARSTPQQAKQPDLDARRRNVQGAFAADAGRVTGKVVLAIDDVTTSGATLAAAARALLDAGATAAHVWALGRED